MFVTDTLVLTALCLVWLSVGGPSVTPQVQAEGGNRQVEVKRVNVGSARRPLEFQLGFHASNCIPGLSASSLALADVSYCTIVVRGSVFGEGFPSPL